jgi:superfamily II RNA helicase
MAGRAGRRGIDTVGHVIHLTNLFNNNDQSTLKTMMKGKPQTLVSKFKISYNLLLNLIGIGETDYTKYAKRSMIQNDIDVSMKVYYDNIAKLQGEIDNMSIVLNSCRTPIQVVQEFIELNQKRVGSVNKKRKDIERNIQSILEQHINVEKEVDIVSRYTLKCDEMKQLYSELVATENTLNTNVTKVIDLLTESGFVKKEDDKNVLSLKGHVATHLREIHCLIFAELIESGKLKQFGAKELVGVLSCFTNITVPEEKRAVLPTSDYSNVKDCIVNIYDMYQKQSDQEIRNKINTGIDYSMHFDIIDYAIRWCDCASDVDCKILINEISLNKEIFLGEFIKAILKINNITSEMEKVAELLGDMEFLSLLREVPQLTLKYVATNQSLYV